MRKTNQISNGVKKKAWVIAVDMGYGHQRTAYPLRYLAFEGKVINANSYEGIPEKDRAIWAKAKAGYEFISRLQRIPLIGKIVFGSFDKIQRILSFYPRRDLSEPNLQLKQTLAPIKKGWGRHLIETLQQSSGQEPLPFIGTFFTAVFMAEHFHYPGEIYCVICDADISRTWASLEPRKSKIKYFAPTSWVVSRLKVYGVEEKNIFFTGYPLPLENIGDEKMEILKQDLENRILNLDPQKQYSKQYKVLINEYFGRLPEKSNHPLTLMFAVGGAGAQKEIGIEIIKSLKKVLKENRMKVILVAGIRKDIKEYFEENIKETGLGKNKNIEIIFAEDIEIYFQKFNEALRTVDVLWTKPSELSFYTGLGLPIIIAPPIGSQEEFNKKWLLRLGSGVPQENPRYSSQWFFDFLNSGRFAEAAMQGFIEGEKLGTLNIEKICFG